MIEQIKEIVSGGGVGADDVRARLEASGFSLTQFRIIGPRDIGSPEMSISELDDEIPGIGILLGYWINAD